MRGSPWCPGSTVGERYLGGSTVEAAPPGGTAVPAAPPAGAAVPAAPHTAAVSEQAASVPFTARPPTAAGGGGRGGSPMSAGGSASTGGAASADVIEAAAGQVEEATRGASPLDAGKALAQAAAAGRRAAADPPAPAAPAPGRAGAAAGVPQPAGAGAVTGGRPTDSRAATPLPRVPARRAWQVRLGAPTQAPRAGLYLVCGAMVGAARLMHSRHGRSLRLASVSSIAAGRNRGRWGASASADVPPTAPGPSASMFGCSLHPPRSCTSGFNSLDRRKQAGLVAMKAYRRQCKEQFRLDCVGSRNELPAVVQVAIGEDGLMRGCSRPPVSGRVAALVGRVLDGGAPLDEAEITFLLAVRGEDLQVPPLPAASRPRLLSADLDCPSDALL